MAMLLGAASLLKDSLESGTVFLVFQPTEEGGVGALKILESGLLKGVEAIFGCHLDRHFKVGAAVAQEGAISAFTDRFEMSIQGMGGHVAQPHDARVEVNITDGYPSVVNAKGETGIAQSVLRSLLGDSSVVDSGYVNMGGEDFSFYLQNIPGCFVMIGAQKEGLENVPAHSAHFDIDERALAVGAAYMAEVAKRTIKNLGKR